MTQEELDALIVLLRKLKATARKHGAPLALIANISDMRKVTDFVRRKSGLK